MAVSFCLRVWVGRNDCIHPVRRRLARMAASFFLHSSFCVPLFMEVANTFFRKQAAYVTVFNPPAA